jgi:hypothetical protein
VTFDADGELWSLGPEVESTLAHYPCESSEDTDDGNRPSAVSGWLPVPLGGCGGLPSPIAVGVAPLLGLRRRRR